MNYQLIYDNIINNASIEKRYKGQGTYYERHHIIPKCLGGFDGRKNTVLLTAREHYICHKLLYKIHPQNDKLFYAWYRTSHKNHVNRKISICSREYEYLKIEYSKRVKGVSYEDRFGKEKAKELKERLRKINLGSKHKISGHKHHAAKKVEVDGVIYDTIKEASDKLKVNYATAKGRFKSNNFNTWKIII